MVRLACINALIMYKGLFITIIFQAVDVAIFCKEKNFKTKKRFNQTFISWKKYFCWQKIVFGWRGCVIFKDKKEHTFVWQKNPKQLSFPSLGIYKRASSTKSLNPSSLRSHWGWTGRTHTKRQKDIATYRQNRPSPQIQWKVQLAWWD